MFKMYLRARVPNEGARRLAWWLGEGGTAALSQLMRVAKLDETMVDRIILGEVVPAADMAWAISRATSGIVQLSTWSSAAVGRWADRPSAIPLRRSPRNRSLMIDDASRGGSPAGSWQRAIALSHRLAAQAARG